MKRQLGASAILLTTAFIWGIAFVAQVLGARFVEPFAFNASRFLLGGLILLPLCFLPRERAEHRGKRKATLLASLCGGSVLFAASILQQFGTGMTANPGRAGFITGIYTVLTPLLYMFFFKRRSGMQVWIGALLAVAGLYLLCYDGTAELAASAGDWLLLAGAVFWAWHIIVVDRFVPYISPMQFACGQFLVCGALNLIPMLCFEAPTWDALLSAKWAILFCGVLSTGVGYTGQVIGQKMAKDPSKAAILLSAESLFSLIGGILWNTLPIASTYPVDASMTVYGLIGCALIFAAVLLAQLPSKSYQTVKEK